MPIRNRRDFLKQAGASVAGMAALKLARWTARAGESPDAGQSSAASTSPGRGIPPHRSLTVPGLHAYSDQQSVAAGQTISFFVSSTVPYRFTICRLGLQVDDPAGDAVLHEFSGPPPKAQPIHPGSYVHVQKGLTQPLRALTLECWVRPWKIKYLAGLMSQYDEDKSCGYGLFLNDSGGVSFYLGDGQRYRSAWMHAIANTRLKAGQWYHLVATWDGREKTVRIDGQEAGRWPFRGIDGFVTAGRAPLRLAAAGEYGLADHFLDGDLAMPVIYGHALDAAQIAARFAQPGLAPARDNAVLACWSFAEEYGSRVADASRNRRHGQISNHATWMIGGPGFQPDVPRFGNYDPRQDECRGHGLRFASDDLYDCRWAVTHKYRVPAAARSGIYVGRFHFEPDGKPCLQHVTFIVRKPPRRKPAPILLLTATNTWRAYSGTPFGLAQSDLKQVWGTGGTTNSSGNPPAFNLYRAHAAGQGTYQVGLRLPWPAAAPYILYGGPTDYSHLMRADRFAQVWLEQAGYDYEVVTDLDLHRHPKLLSDYRVVVINGHSEYWSLPMYDGLENYLKQGGNVICLSGNSLFWRVSFNDDCTIMECRKLDAPGEQVPAARRGEAWHSHDGGRGGLMRECGFPGWRLIGLDSLGWNNQSDPKEFGPYLVDQPDHFLFNHPEPVGLKNGDAIGQSPDGRLPRANGHEFDVRLSTLATLQELPPPAGASLPPEPAGITRLANGVVAWKKDGTAFDYFIRFIKPRTNQGGEMIYWERPEGGRVFNAGSIGSGWALLADPKFQRLLSNVLHHFGVKG